MEVLEQSDRKVLDAAEGWLGLGSWRQAETELVGITPKLRRHPDVLKVRWQILAAQGKWVLAGQIARSICTLAPDDPFGWAHLAYAAHKLDHTSEARNVLLTVVDDFPGEYSIRYDLACYTCQLGNLGEAWYWLQKALELPHSKKLDRMALQDPSLEPLWRTLLRK
jgi:hypothetical protein